MADYTGSTSRGPADEQETRTRSKTDVADFLHKAVKRFAKVESSESGNRMQAIDDLKFVAGEQWPDQIKAQRTIEKRPCLTINKLPTFVHQITNDQRQNRPSIKVSPVGDKSDLETAKMLRGLIKQIERTSNADIAYDVGFESAVKMGWGYWRILTDYEDEDTFDQVIKIMQITNPFTVYMDPDSKMPDGSDAKWCFISSLMTRDEFEDEFPGSDTWPWEEGSQGDEWKSWSTSSHVRIAEYYCTETEMRELVQLDNGHVGWKDELSESILASVQSNPDSVVESRDVPCHKIKWYKITSKEILEENEWAGKYIPVIKVVGEMQNVEGKIKLNGLVRAAKDPQRMYNFWCTSETELIALAPKAPWLMEEGQIEGHELRWKEANNKSLPYLLYKGVNLAGKPAPPPQRQQFAGPPAGVVQAKISAAQDMQAVTGIRFDATHQERSYDESGKALRELKQIGDLGNFHYVDNLSRSLKYTGKILIDLIPKIYDTPRVLTILREDESEERVKIDPNMGKAHDKATAPNGQITHLYNPKLGEYGVTVSIGPSFATKRAEAADSMLQFMRFVPQSGPLIGDLIAKNMDWPGADEIAARMASMLPPHLLDKKVEQLPPEAKALVSSLMQQMQNLKQEYDHAVQMLGDKEKDRDIEKAAVMNEREAISKDFESKMTKIQADVMTKLAAIEGKTDDGGKGNTAVMKALLDFQAKLEKIAADQHIKLLELDMKSMERDQKAKDDARQEKEAKAKEPTKAPVINIHIPRGKKKITKSKDGSYIAEDIEEQKPIRAVIEQ